MPGKGNSIVIKDDGSKGGYLIVPFYEDETALPNTVKFQVRYFNKEIYAEKHKNAGSPLAQLASGGGGGEI